MADPAIIGQNRCWCTRRFTMGLHSYGRGEAAPWLLVVIRIPVGAHPLCISPRSQARRCRRDEGLQRDPPASPALPPGIPRGGEPRTPIWVCRPRRARGAEGCADAPAPPCRGAGAFLSTRGGRKGRESRGQPVAGAPTCRHATRIQF